MSTFEFPTPDLLAQVRELITCTQLGSEAMVQRKFHLSFAQAARCMEVLEEEGIVGPKPPSGGARPVLITNPTTSKEDTPMVTLQCTHIHTTGPKATQQCGNKRNVDNAVDAETFTCEKHGSVQHFILPTPNAIKLQTLGAGVYTKEDVPKEDTPMLTIRPTLDEAKFINTLLDFNLVQYRANQLYGTDYRPGQTYMKTSPNSGQALDTSRPGMIYCGSEYVGSLGKIASGQGAMSGTFVIVFNRAGKDRTQVPTDMFHHPHTTEDPMNTTPTTPIEGDVEDTTVKGRLAELKRKFGEDSKAAKNFQAYVDRRAAQKAAEAKENRPAKQFTTHTPAKVYADSDTVKVTCTGIVGSDEKGRPVIHGLVQAPLADVKGVHKFVCEDCLMNQDDDGLIQAEMAVERFLESRPVEDDPNEGIQFIDEL